MEISLNLKNNKKTPFEQEIWNISDMNQKRKNKHNSWFLKKDPPVWITLLISNVGTYQ